MARHSRPPSSRRTKKRDTWDMLRGWQVKSIPDEEDETGMYCWGKRKTNVDPYTNFELWRKLYRGWDPFLCDITAKCSAIENISGFVDESLDDHLKKDVTRIRDASSKVAVGCTNDNEDHTPGQAETATDHAETTPDDTEEAGSSSQSTPAIQAEVNGEDAERRLFPNEWAGTDSKKEVDEKTLLSVRCDVRNSGSTPATVSLDPSDVPDRHNDAGSHARDVRQRYGYTSERYSPNDENRRLSYIRISKAYPSVNDETESDNIEDYTRTAIEDSTSAKPVRLQYTRSNVMFIPEAYHNEEAGKRCLNSQRSDANKSECGQYQDNGCDVANGSGQRQNDARHLANGASEPGGEHDGGQVAQHKHAALVLKKVTLQESGGDGDAAHPVASTAQRPVSAVKGVKYVHDKQRSDALARADQQNRESRSNMTKSGSGNVWSSGKQDQSYFSIRDLFPAVDKLNVRRSFPQRSSRPLGSVVIDDGSKRETKFVNKERLTTDTTRSFTMREGIEHLRQKERLQMPGGPPSFRPTKNRTPLHRAMEMTKKRMFGHWMPGGQGGDEIDIPTRWQSILGGSFSAPPDGAKLVNSGDETQRRNYTTRHTTNYDTMGFGKDPAYSDTRAGRMQSVYESTLSSLYKLSRQRRQKLGWNQTTAALLQTHTQLDYELQGVARSRTAADDV